MFKEKSQRLNGETQYNYKFEKAGLFLVAGLNYQQDRPNGYGITLVDSFHRILVNQYGVVLQLEKTLPLGIRLIGATRFDYHDNFGDFLSPKLAVVKALKDGSFRITWGKAVSMPSILNQYAGINRSLFGNGEGIRYIPNNTKISDPASMKITEALKPEQVSTWELGYKGTIMKKLYIDVNYYNGISKNFISPARSVPGRAMFVGDIPVTHNPFNAGVDSNGILKLASFSTFFNYAEVKAEGIDIGLTYSFNKNISLAVKYSWFGSDITKDDSKNDANKDGVVSLEEISLNAPHNRGAIILDIQNIYNGKIYGNISARILEEYDFYSGSQIGTKEGEGSRGKVDRPPLPPVLKNFDWGPLGGFTTIDLSAGYRINKMVSAGMSITNLLNTKQIEFVGSPSISRLISFEIKLHVPNK